MNKKTVIIILSVMILGLSIGYAALSSSLNITGTARLGATADSWNINFKNAKCTGYNYAEAGNIEIKNKTTLEISGIEFNAPGDFVICTFDIVNEGTIDAKVTSITNPDKNKFTYTGSGRLDPKSFEGDDIKVTKMAQTMESLDKELVKNNLITEMKYQDNSEIKLRDELNAKETKKAYIKISLSENMERLPQNEVTVSNIFGQIIYGQYKVGDKDITKELIPYKVGELVYYNPVSNEMDCTNYTESNSLNENKTGCMKWYVIASSDETMDVILDHNTTYKVAWNDGTTASNTSNEEDEIIAKQVEDTTNKPVTANAKLASDVSGWNSQAKNTARMITADEIWSITSSTNGKTNWSSSTALRDDWFSFNSNDGQGYGWLFGYTYGCMKYGCNVEDSGTYGYWTSSFVVGSDVQSDFAWLVSQRGRLDWSDGRVGNVDWDVVYDVAEYFGLRPVITISKS